MKCGVACSHTPDELVIEKEKYKIIGDDLDSAFVELYGY
jgi:hypothetical protein